MSIETGRTDAGFAGRASHADRSCAKARRRLMLIAAPAPTPSLRNPRRSSACECLLFISPSASVACVDRTLIARADPLRHVIKQVLRRVRIVARCGFASGAGRAAVRRAVDHNE